MLIHFTMYGVLDSNIKMSRLSLMFLAVLYANLVFEIINYPRITVLLMILTLFFQIEIDLNLLIQTVKYP